MEPDPFDLPEPSPAAGEAPRAGGAHGIPLMLVGAAVCAAATLGIVLGVRVGRSVGRAQLGEPTRVQTVMVERCADCAKRAEQIRATNGTTPAEVEAMIARQAEVERATEI